MDLIADRGRRVTVEELNTTKLLAHASEQAKQRKFEDILIVDSDAHHYESEHMDEILPFMENEVLKQLAMSARAKGGPAYVELDLYDPALVRGNTTLVVPVWAPLLDLTGPDRAILYERGPGSWILLLETMDRGPSSTVDTPSASPPG